MGSCCNEFNMQNYMPGCTHFGQHLLPIIVRPQQAADGSCNRLKVVILISLGYLKNLEVSAGRPSLFFVLMHWYLMSDQLIKRLKEIAEPVVGQQDMFLVDIEVKTAKKMEVWILVDSESGGVNLDSCSKISREIGFILDENDVIDGAFRLNVSSPGLSRPLTDSRQYAKNSGRQVKVKYKSGSEYETAEGELANVIAGDSFMVMTGKNLHKKIAFSDVVETKVIPKI
jgi:ribosome maturation factor RimP